MLKINFKEHVLPHGFAIVVFLIVTIFFFNPVFFDNRSISQHDIQQWAGSSKALRDYRAQTGQEGLWVSTMFSGMPAYLVNLDWSDGVLVGMKKVMSLFLPHPIANIFLAFISYYIMLLAFRVRPYLAIAGALAFGLSSYMIIGLSAGHNGRIGAIAFMPLVIAGIHLAFNKKRILGFGVTALGLALHMRENHVQITYYLMLIVAGYGLVHLIIAAREKKLTEFFKSLVILIPAAVIAALTFFGPFWGDYEYKQYSIRGPSELVQSGQTAPSDGLTKAYAFAYNYGIYEPMTLLIPQFYGGASSKAFGMDGDSESYKALMQSGDDKLANKLLNYTVEYWGPQAYVAGPYYGGAIVVFLFVVGILFAERRYVWWLVPLSALSLMLSWGDSFPTFNYFMFDYFPGINLFRSVNFALIIILLAMPLLGMLGVERVLSQEITKQVKTKLLIAFGATGGLCLLLLLLVFVGVGPFVKAGESQLPKWFLTALQADRKSLFQADAFRSLAFIFSIFILLFLNAPKKVSIVTFYGFLILMMIVDLSAVDKRYFTSDNYQRARDNSSQMATAADEAILRDKGYYRVYNLQDAMNEARTSYFHNSLGGYHGAKMRRYQDLFDSAIYPQTLQLFADLRDGNPDFNQYGVLNMLNTKYMTYGPDADNIIPNEAANGPAWFVEHVQLVNSANQELEAVANVDTKKVAVIDKSKFSVQQVVPDSSSVITLTDHKPNYLKYESQSSQAGLAVFSEIFYPKGWYATLDGNDVPILRTDYVLRALEIPAGKHVIEFRFEPKPYVIGNKVTMASSWILLILVLGSLGWSLKKS